jgi:hypothetical protein
MTDPAEPGLRRSFHHVYREPALNPDARARIETAPLQTSTRHPVIRDVVVLALALVVFAAPLSIALALRHQSVGTVSPSGNRTQPAPAVSAPTPPQGSPSASATACATLPAAIGPEVAGSLTEKDSGRTFWSACERLPERAPQPGGQRALDRHQDVGRHRAAAGSKRGADSRPRCHGRGLCRRTGGRQPAQLDASTVHRDSGIRLPRWAGLAGHHHGRAIGQPPRSHAGWCRATALPHAAQRAPRRSTPGQPPSAQEHLRRG